MVLEVGHCTDRGHRSTNQDAVLVDAGLGYAVIADGMGGPAGGEEASRLAVEAARELLAGLGEPDTGPEPELLVRVIREANERIFEAAERKGLLGMGTTMVCLTVRRGRYTVAHAGDSRAYRISRGALAQLTKDHSLVQEQVDAGLLTPRQAAHHPLRNVITRAVGTDASVDADVSQGDVAHGDVFLLTTDGVHGAVPADRLQALAWGAPPQWAAEELVREALRLGTRDNATVAVVRAVPENP
ncbi:MAG: serine/threonine-protein phosphatase [Deltaproteobacteria bacterium]|nr:serine/threonine-protein phosphatase [Deltaproteobacteria bacterium]